MFPLSTQKKHWMFCDESDINKLREGSNMKYVAKFGSNVPVSIQKYVA